MATKLNASRTSSKRKRKNDYDSEKEEDLEKVVFGRDSDVIRSLHQEEDRSDFKGTLEQEDTSSNSSASGESEPEDDAGEAAAETEGKEKGGVGSSDEQEPSKRAKWIDEDDDIILEEGMKGVLKFPSKVTATQKYKDYLETKFSQFHQKPKWASKKDSDRRPGDEGEDSDDDDNLLQSVGDYISRDKKLPKRSLTVKKCTNLNAENPFKGIVGCVQFHPSSTVGLVSSAKGIVNLFQVDGKINSKIQSIHFEKYEIERARFSVDGEQLYVGSKVNKGSFYCYDMIAGKIIKIPFVKGKEKLAFERFVLSPDGGLIACKGKGGQVHVLDANTRENVLNFKMNGDLTCLTFTRDSSRLFTHGNEGRVYVWDVRNSSKCLHRFSDEGCITGTGLAVSPNEQYLATGSDVGVVNVYRLEEVMKSNDPKPVKAAMNLTTEVTCLKFNHSSEMLAMSSSYKDNALKCLHVPSFNVLPDFPVSGTYLRRVQEFDVSPNSGYLGFGNNKGAAHLYRLCHFNDY